MTPQGIGDAALQASVARREVRAMSASGPRPGQPPDREPPDPFPGSGGSQ